MRADVWSLGLVIYEVIFEQEPFEDLTQLQLQTQVGKQKMTPEIPDDVNVNSDAMDMLQRTWKFGASDRPSVAEVCDLFERVNTLFNPASPLDSSSTNGAY